MAESLCYGTRGAFLFLSEDQNAAFDREYHSKAELEAKFSLLEGLMGKETFSVLDLGGGNGKFADEFLARFPKSSVTILDISRLLLDRNSHSSRKELICGSVESMSETFAGRSFDCITVNWVLHHLTGNDYQACLENVLDTLDRCRQLLKPNGILLVTENMFDGCFGSNIPSRLIYTITAVRHPWFVRLAKRFFNTAGVGVCFQSREAWASLFARGGFDLVTLQKGKTWERTIRRDLAFRLLFLKPVSHGHFFLKPSAHGAAG
jgi:ubiquinone/menaquinone biosynthesis C-methylase UbiE